MFCWCEWDIRLSLKHLYISHFCFFQATRNDRIYVNSPDAQKGDSGNIQILSFTQSSKVEDETGKENKGMTNDEGNNEDDDSEETLTPGDLLAFAWQISEGMVRQFLNCVSVPIKG